VTHIVVCVPKRYVEEIFVRFQSGRWLEGAASKRGSIAFAKSQLTMIGLLFASGASSSSSSPSSSHGNHATKWHLVTRLLGLPHIELLPLDPPPQLELGLENGSANPEHLLDDVCEQFGLNEAQRQ
jgi:hypothetical protein